MAMIEPGEGKKVQRDPEEGNIPTGVYWCELTRVDEIDPSAKYPNGNRRLVFEFTVLDPKFPKLAGKTAIAFLGKTLHKSRDGKESNLVKWARMMGVVEPEKGFDPDRLVGKKYQVTVEYDKGTGDQPGRGWARSAVLTLQEPPAAGAPPASAPASGPPADGPPADGPPAGGSGPDPAARWDYHTGDNWVRGATTAEVQHWITQNKQPAHLVWVKPAGSGDAPQKALALGFRDHIPF